MLRARNLKFHIARPYRMPAVHNSARIGVDIGGTFTDVILQYADGRATIRKLLSTPPNYDAAVVEAVAAMTDGANVAGVVRSEERRVGKECRARGGRCSGS